jgi:uncharacterized hydantoinase/oxoprolinase family protein
MSIDPYDLSQLTAAIQVGLNPTVQNISSLVARTMFQELWTAASPEQRAEVADAMLVWVRNSIKNGQFQYDDKLRVPQPVIEEALTQGAQQIKEALVRRACQYIEEADKYRGADADVRTAVSEITRKAAATVLAERLPEIEKAVANAVSDDVIDEAVKRHAKDMLAALQRGPAKI